MYSGTKQALTIYMRSARRYTNTLTVDITTIVISYGGCQS